MTAGDPFAPFFTALRGINDVLFRDAGIPGLASLPDSYRRNLKAIEDANRVLIEGALEATSRQARIFQQSLAEAAQLLTPGEAPSIEGKVDTVRRAVELAIGRMREMHEGLAKANLEAIDLLRSRLVASFEEVLDAAEPKPAEPKAAKPVAAPKAAASTAAAPKAVAPVKPTVAKPVDKKPAAPTKKATAPAKKSVPAKATPAAKPAAPTVKPKQPVVAKSVAKPVSAKTAPAAKPAAAAPVTPAPEKADA